jgi:hypothetical protein
VGLAPANRVYQQNLDFARGNLEPGGTQ